MDSTGLLEEFEWSSVIGKSERVRLYKSLSGTITTFWDNWTYVFCRTCDADDTPNWFCSPLSDSLSCLTRCSVSRTSWYACWRPALIACWSSSSFSSRLKRKVCCSMRKRLKAAGSRETKASASNISLKPRFKASCWPRWVASNNLREISLLVQLRCSFYPVTLSNWWQTLTPIAPCVQLIVDLSCIVERATGDWGRKTLVGSGVSCKPKCSIRSTWSRFQFQHIIIIIFSNILLRRYLYPRVRVLVIVLVTVVK